MKSALSHWWLLMSTASKCRPSIRCLLDSFEVEHLKSSPMFIMLEAIAIEKAHIPFSSTAHHRTSRHRFFFATRIHGWFRTGSSRRATPPAVWWDPVPWSSLDGERHGERRTKRGPQEGREGPMPSLFGKSQRVASFLVPLILEDLWGAVSWLGENGRQTGEGQHSRTDNYSTWHTRTWSGLWGC